jgi:Pyruvate/2-oxoacid:ferredoxin oxidoreductase delta subunit
LRLRGYLSSMDNERKPLLSDERINGIQDAACADPNDDIEWRAAKNAACIVRDIYEAKITSGELRVVEEVALDANFYCSGCGQWCGEDNEMTGKTEDAGFDWCPGCGNKIKR